MHRFKRFIQTFSFLYLTTSLALAQSSSLRQGASRALYVIAILAFLVTVVLIIGAGLKYKNGNVEEAKLMLIGGGIIGGSIVLATAFFDAFGLSGATVSAESF